MSLILAVVAVSVLVLLGLAAWVALAPYAVSADLAGRVVACDTAPGTFDQPAEAVASWAESCSALEDEARSGRRRTAGIIGAVVVVAAWAVSTWPSRRLTGERLGPLPDRDSG